MFIVKAEDDVFLSSSCCSVMYNIFSAVNGCHKKKNAYWMCFFKFFRADTSGVKISFLVEQTKGEKKVKISPHNVSGPARA